MSRRPAEAVLALILLLAAILKARQLFTHSAPLISSLNHHKAALPALIEAELVLAAWMLAGGFPRARFVCATACFTLFAAVAGYEAFHAMPSCGCFGNVKVPPLLTTAFDLSATLALCFTQYRRSPPTTTYNAPPSPRRLLFATLIVALASVALWTGYFLNQPPSFNGQSFNPQNGLVVLEPATWLNKPFPLFDEIDGGDKLRSGRWIVLLYHHDCDSCRQAIPAYRLLAVQAGTGSRIAFVAMPPAATGGDDPVPPSLAYVRLTLRPTYDWFATTPVVIAIEDGRVVTAAEGEMAVRPPRILGW